MANLENEAKTVSASNREVFAFVLGLLKYHPWGWAIASLGVLVGRGMWIAGMYALKLAVDAAAKGDGQNFALWMMASGAFYILRALSKRLKDFTADITTDKTRYIASNQAMELLVKKDASFYEDRFSGTLSRAVANIGGLFSQLNDQVMWNVLPFVFGVSLILVALWSMSPLIALVVLFWISVFIVVISKMYIAARATYSEKTEAADQKYAGVVADTFSNIQTVSLFGNAKHELGAYGAASRDLLEKNILQTKGYSWIDVVASTISTLLYLSVLAAMYFSWRTGGLTPGDLLFIQAQTIDALDSSWGFSASISRINRTLASFAQTLGMMSEESKVTDMPGAKTIKVNQGIVSFNNVSFAYKSGSNALKKASFELEAGKVYALVGHSGAGKSTIIKMLLRMYDPTSGSIKIDGQDLRDVTLESLRKSIAYVPQDPALFHRSIADNIRYARPKASMADVIAAAKQAQCHGFVSKLAKGYDSVVGERGAKLSGGERQRVAIARAILKDAPILLLDEATSSLDSDSEHEVQKALEAVMKHRTSIIIAHRLSTVRKADRILVVEGGRIVDQGSHQELLGREGIYKGLWERQSGVII